MMRYFINDLGVYLGAYDENALIPAGAIEVKTPPLDGRDIWTGAAWDETERRAIVEDIEAKDKLIEIDLGSIRAIREYIVSKSDAPKELKDKEAQAIAERLKVKK